MVFYLYYTENKKFSLSDFSLKKGSSWMNINKMIVTEMTFPYAVSIFHCSEGLAAVAASESRGICKWIKMDTLATETIWDDTGGTMAICQLDKEGNFLAVQEFFKGFNSKTACIALVRKNKNGGWSYERYIDLPFVHRFCIVNVEDRRFILASTLCGDKDFKDDWSKPGKVYLFELNKELTFRPKPLKPLIDAIRKNHGMFKGTHNGVPVVLVTGAEGVFEISIPATVRENWEYTKLIEGEVSEAILADLDSDGDDELITIEGFHGDKVKIYKKVKELWEVVYSLPISFGHVLWGGKILGKPSLLVGYRSDNAALLLLRKQAGAGFVMDITYIDQDESPLNIDTIENRGVFKILCTGGGKGRVIQYEITE
jgi:hypothetical protein